MTQKLFKSVSPTRKAETNTLFNGIWIRWRALTAAERFACANIVLLPAWWVIGMYSYMPLLLLLGVALYEWRQHKRLRLRLPSLPVVTLIAFGVSGFVKVWFTLNQVRAEGVSDISIFVFLPALLFWYIQSNSIRKRPSLPVIALFLFGLYQLIEIVFAFGKVQPVGLSDIAIHTFCPAFLLWHVQSNNIRIRLEVVAWAFTVSVIQVIGFWFASEFILPENIFLPPRLRTFWSLLTGDLGNLDSINQPAYLQPYVFGRGIGGLNRYSAFFIYPEFFGVVAGAISLIGLDIKNRFWSWLLFSAGVFLILLSSTRAVWVTFPTTVGLYYMFSSFEKRWGPAIVLGLIALLSFTILSVSPVTDLILDRFTQTAQSIDKVREGSTDNRAEIYSQTWKGIQEKPIWGHSTQGPQVDPYVPNGVVGSHSFILGNLLYLNGLVGTAIFTVFWISLFVWLYQTRVGRPLSCFCLLILYTFLSPTTPLVYDMPPSNMLLLLSITIRCPKQTFAPSSSLFRRLRYA